MKPSPQNALVALEQAAVRLAAAARGWLAWPALYGLAAGVTAWGATHSAQLAALSSNKLTAADRAHALGYVGRGLCAVGALYLLAVVLVRLRTRAWQVARTTTWLNRLLAGTLAGPFVVALATPNIESSSPLLALL